MFLGQQEDDENNEHMPSDEENKEDLYYPSPNLRHDASRGCNLGNDPVMSKVAAESYLIESFHQHDSLLEPASEEELSENEKTLAWRRFFQR